MIEARDSLENLSVLQFHTTTVLVLVGVGEDWIRITNLEFVRNVE